MKSEQFLENADNCAQLAEKAEDKPTRLRYERMEAAWRSLAEQQDWLDGVPFHQTNRFDDAPACKQEKR